MQDPPHPPTILAAAATFMRTPVPPEAAPHAAFISRVAANGLDIAKRELTLAPKSDAEELARLKALLGEDGTLASLNQRLCEKIEAGEITFATPGFTDHLWATTLAKLEVDQPNYSGYKAALAERGA
ncbi:MAG: DUF6285 domain-containing protein [Caulobacteraceae bacterium]